MSTKTLKLVRDMPAAFRPSRCAAARSGWRKPELSRRKIAELRKRTLKAGEAWAWDPPMRPVLPVRMKGHKHQRTHDERKARIEEAMKAMPERIAAYRAKAAAKRVKKDTFAYLLRDKSDE